MKINYSSLLKLSAIFFLFWCSFFTNAQQQALEDLSLQFSNSLKLAQGGAPLEMYNVGYHYLTGMGVKKNVQEAKRWFKRAEQTNSGAVHYKLGRLLERGDLLEKNVSKAVAHYKYSAQQGDPYGLNNYGLLLVRGKHVDQDIEKGIDWLMEAARQDMSQSMLNLGFAYLMRKEGEHNKEQAIEWFKAAADKDIVEAQYQLGNIYRKDGNYAQSFYYLEQAANAKHSEAQLYLAMLFDKGWGVPKDRTKANYWLNQSANLGNEKAKRVLGKK